MLPSTLSPLESTLIPQMGLKIDRLLFRMPCHQPRKSNRPVAQSPCDVYGSGDASVMLLLLRLFQRPHQTSRLHSHMHRPLLRQSTFPSHRPQASPTADQKPSVYAGLAYASDSELLPHNQSHSSSASPQCYASSTDAYAPRFNLSSLVPSSPQSAYASTAPCTRCNPRSSATSYLKRNACTSLTSLLGCTSRGSSSE